MSLIILINYIGRMNSSNEFTQVGVAGVLTKSILTEKKFELSNIEWKYQNNFQLSLLAEAQSSKLRIQNHLCEMNDNKIKKITEITYQNRKYVIEDIYAIDLPQHQVERTIEHGQRQTKDGASTNDSDKNENKDKRDDKKVYIFKKISRSRRNRDGSDDNFRNTKNVSKNFCKAFISYLKSQKVGQLERRRVREAIKAYNSLLECKKYNNNLIKQIIGNQQLSGLFKHFLETEARNWINESKVNDKGLHHQAIDIYLNLFSSTPSNSLMQEDEEMGDYLGKEQKE